MIVTNLRSSSITTFKSCPMAWFLEYNLGWDSGANKAAIKGTIVHHVLEYLALLKQADQEGKSSIATGIKPARLYVKNYLTTNRLIDKLTNDIYNHHVAKYDLNWIAKDKQDCVKWVNKVLEGDFDPRKREIIEAEKFFDIEIIKPWSAYKYELPDGEILQGFLSVKGTIDLITKIPNAIEIVDWKTGKCWDWTTSTAKTIDDIKDDIQPRMYHYVESQNFPDKQIIVTMNYINDGGPRSVYYDENDLDKTEKLLQHYFKTIQSATPTCNKSWRCSKFCGFGKTTFENTSITPIKHNNVLTQCQQVEYTLQHKSEEQVLANMCNGNLQENLNAYHQG